jgi:hypothetical protein
LLRLPLQGHLRPYVADRGNHGYRSQQYQDRRGQPGQGAASVAPDRGR